MTFSLTLAQAILWIGNISLLAVFALAGATKLRDQAHAHAGLTGFGVPERWAQSLLIVLALTEIAVAMLLAYPPTQRIAALGALSLLSLFTVAIAWQLLRGHRPACACFGSLSQATIGWKNVCRNLLLMTITVGLITLPKANTLWLSSEVIPLSALVGVIWIVFSAVWLLHLTRQNGRLLLRIEQLEQVAAQPASAQPAPQVQPLQVGMPLPPLRLNDGHGHPFELRRFRGMPIQLLFLDDGCTHCRALIAYLHELSLANTNTALIVISETAALRHQLPVEVTLLLDPGWSTMALFGLRGTPAAVSVDADGLLAQLAVHGTTAVRSALNQVFAQEAQHELATI